MPRRPEVSRNGTRPRRRHAAGAAALVICASAGLRTARTGTALAPGPGRGRRIRLAWPRLPAAAELAIIAAGYFGYALVRLAVKASHTSAFAHAAQLWHAEKL